MVVPASAPRLGPPQGQYQAFCPRSRRVYVLVAAILASAMGFIDGSVVAIALPATRESLGAGLTAAQWIHNGYLLPLSALILVGGALGDGYGLRRVFIGGIALFTAASIACALAPTTAALIAARVLQGIAAAAMVPGSLAIISKTYPREERGRAIGLWAAASAITTAAGPVLGGLLLSAAGPEGWRWIFAINLPVGALALALLILRVPPDQPVEDPRIDWPGAVLATAGLGLLAWGLTGAAEGHGPGLGVAAAGLGLLLGFLGWERRAPHPMMPLRLFAAPGFAAANLLTFALYFALSGVLFFLPMTLIGGWGLDPARAGLVFVPLSVAIALGSGPVGRLADRFGAAPLLAAGSAIVAAAIAGLGAFIGLQSFWAHVLPAMILFGLGMALVVAPLSVAVMGAVAGADSGAASGINNAVSRVSGLVAVAALGPVAAGAAVMAGGTGAFAVPGAPAEATAAGFRAVAFACAGAAAFAAVLAGRVGRGGAARKDP